MSVLDDVFGKEPQQRSASFCLDAELAQRLSGAQVELQTAKTRAGRMAAAGAEAQAEREAVQAAQALVDELIELVRPRLIRFVFSAIQPGEYEHLVTEHPPTREQVAAAAKAKESVPDVNVVSFPPALLAASCSRVESPSGTVEGLSVEDAERLWGSATYNDAERAELFNAALAATKTRFIFDVPAPAPVPAGQRVRV